MVEEENGNEEVESSCWRNIYFGASDAQADVIGLSLSPTNLPQIFPPMASSSSSSDHKPKVSQVSSILPMASGIYCTDITSLVHYDL